MAHFFVSYTSSDRAWAEWIAFVLEEEGLSTVIQAWDFRPSSNFVLEMQRAAAGADRTIMVLSPDYLTSQFASAEWASAFADDPSGLGRKLLPVTVRECSPAGLLRAIVRIDLTGLDEESARSALLAGALGKRAKPSRRPAFPAAMAAREPKAFPGPKRATTTGRDSKTDAPKPEPDEPDDRNSNRWGFAAIQLLGRQLISLQSRVAGRASIGNILIVVTGFAVVVLGARWLTCRHLTRVIPAELWLSMC
jgi:hypothetical protein